jgi:plastocyanin
MMSWRPVATLVVGALLLLAACGSGRGSASPLATTAGPSGTPSASDSPLASASPVANASPVASASPAASVCRQSDDPGVVAVSIADFEFTPASIEAKVGQVVSFSNTGFESHNATTVEGGCGTRTLQTGKSDGLVFSVPGSYRFGCTVHPWMTGTFTIAP